MAENIQIFHTVYDIAQKMLMISAVITMKGMRMGFLPKLAW